MWNKMVGTKMLLSRSRIQRKDVKRIWFHQQKIISAITSLCALLDQFNCVQFSVCKFCHPNILKPFVFKSLVRPSHVPSYKSLSCALNCPQRQVSIVKSIFKASSSSVWNNPLQILQLLWTICWQTLLGKVGTPHAPPSKTTPPLPSHARYFWRSIYL